MIIADLKEGMGVPSPQALASPALGMASYRQDWAQLQGTEPAVITNDPNDPSWNWSFFDAAIAQATQFNKPIFFRINIQGTDAPRWAINESSNYVAVNGKQIAIWWAPFFTNAVTALIQAAATRYASNPLIKIVDFNIAASGTGDWNFPTGSTSWTLTSTVTCPAWGGSVVVTSATAPTVGWVGTLPSFGWFQVTAVSGTGPYSVTIENFGITGNASSGTINNGTVFTVNDIANLQGPVYRYTTARLVAAVTNIISVIHAAWPNQVVNQEIGHSDGYDPFPASVPTGLGSAVQAPTIGAASGTNPYTKSYGSNVTAGSLLVVAVSWGVNASSITSFTDTLNASQWLLVNIIQASGRSLAVYCFQNTLGGACQVQMTLSVAESTVDFALYEFPAPAGGYVDVTATATGTGTNPLTASIVPTYSTDLVLACIRGTSVSAGQTGWSAQTFGDMGAQYIQPGSSAAIAASFTQTSTACITIIVAFSSLVQSGTLYDYNASTQIAQWGYANIPKGYFAIEKDTYQATSPTPAVAIADGDAGSLFYLPAQTLAGSSNTSGTTGVIPAGSLMNGQCAWQAYDPTGAYAKGAPLQDGNGLNYAANAGIPYSNPYPIFIHELQTAQLYNLAVLEVYDVDVAALLNNVKASPGGGAGGGGGTAVVSSMQFPFNRR